jgi:hypothetical protein
VDFRRRKKQQKQNRKINRKMKAKKKKIKETKQRKQLIGGNDKMMKCRLQKKMEMKMQEWVKKRRRRQDQKVREEKK